MAGDLYNQTGQQKWQQIASNFEIVNPENGSHRNSYCGTEMVPPKKWSRIQVRKHVELNIIGTIMGSAEKM